MSRNKSTFIYEHTYADYWTAIASAGTCGESYWSENRRGDRHITNGHCNCVNFARAFDLVKTAPNKYSLGSCGVLEYTYNDLPLIKSLKSSKLPGFCWSVVTRDVAQAGAYM
jgi:hypothetical protein